MSNYPPGYNGQDAPSQTVVLRCENAHYWQTVQHFECGAAIPEEDCCPYCGEMFDEITDHDEVPPEDEWDDDDE